MIYMENDNTLVVQDNGRGMTQQEFIELSKPYTRKKDKRKWLWFRTKHMYSYTKGT
jgi:hypothetical protein